MAGAVDTRRAVKSVSWPSHTLPAAVEQGGPLPSCSSSLSGKCPFCGPLSAQLFCIWWTWLVTLFFKEPPSTGPECLLSCAPQREKVVTWLTGKAQVLDKLVEASAPALMAVNLMLMNKHCVSTTVCFSRRRSKTRLRIDRLMKSWDQRGS